jgi:hypothetical protein
LELRGTHRLTNGIRNDPFINPLRQVVGTLVVEEALERVAREPFEAEMRVHRIRVHRDGEIRTPQMRRFAEGALEVDDDREMLHLLAAMVRICVAHSCVSVMT